MTVSVHCHSDDVINTMSGGIIVLKKLVKDLCALGINARLSIPSNEFRNADVAVYAEGVHGNPLNGKLCVKFLLFHQPEDFSYGTDEIIFKHVEKFRCRQPEQVAGLLTTFDHDLNFWVNQSRERSGICYAIRKGAHKVNYANLNMLRGAVCIDTYPNHEYLLDCFNKYAMFVSFDHATSLSIQAALCGCVSVVIPENGLSAEDWRETFRGLKYGIAYGMNDLDYAEKTMPFVKENLRRMQKQHVEEAKYFVQYCKGKLS